MNPHKVTADFEQALCDYTGAPFAVCVNSCTMALLLAVEWYIKRRSLQQFGRSKLPLPPAIEIPKLTYVSVPMSIIHAGGRPTFRDEEWSGAYQLKPLPLWDSARYFTSGMYRHGAVDGAMICVSFHSSKTLGIEQGGAILHDNSQADAWLRRARFDGRTSGVAPKDDHFTQVGWHCYMNPSTAAQGLLKLHSLPKHNAPLPNDEYTDLSEIDWENLK